MDHSKICFFIISMTCSVFYSQAMDLQEIRFNEDKIRAVTKIIGMLYTGSEYFQILRKKKSICSMLLQSDNKHLLEKPEKNKKELRDLIELIVYNRTNFLEIKNFKDNFRPNATENRPFNSCYGCSGSLDYYFEYHDTHTSNKSTLDISKKHKRYPSPLHSPSSPSINIPKKQRNFAPVLPF